MVQDVKFDTFQSEVLSSRIPVIVDFWSPACGPCRLQDPILRELEEQSAGQFEIRKVNVWDESELATQFNVNAVPTLLFFNQGQVVKSLVGYQDKNRLLRALADLNSQPVASQSGGTRPTVMS